MMDLLIVPLPDGSGTTGCNSLGWIRYQLYPYQKDLLPVGPLQDRSATNSTATRWIQFQMNLKILYHLFLYLMYPPSVVYPYQMYRSQLYLYQTDPLPGGSATGWICYPLHPYKVDNCSMFMLPGVTLLNRSATNCSASGRIRFRLHL
jgi:hypothetical protein